MTKRSTKGLQRDYRAMNDWYIKHGADGQWSVAYRSLSWLESRRKACAVRRACWL